EDHLRISAGQRGAEGPLPAAVGLLQEDQVRVRVSDRGDSRFVAGDTEVDVVGQQAERRAGGRHGPAGGRGMGAPGGDGDQPGEDPRTSGWRPHSPSWIEPRRRNRAATTEAERRVLNDNATSSVK